MLFFFTFLNSFYKPTIVFLSSFPPPTPPPNAPPLTLRKDRHEHLWWTPKGIRDNWLTTFTNWKMKGNALLRAEHLGYWLSTSISAIEFPFYRETGAQQTSAILENLRQSRDVTHSGVVLWQICLINTTVNLLQKERDPITHSSSNYREKRRWG